MNAKGVSNLVHLEHAGMPLSHFFLVLVHFSQARLARSTLLGVPTVLGGEFDARSRGDADMVLVRVPGILGRLVRLRVYCKVISF